VQSVSIFGIPGLSFLIYWVNISIAEIFANNKSTYYFLQIPISVIVLFVIFGALPFDFYKSKRKPTITVAIVGTNSEISGLPFASAYQNKSIIILCSFLLHLNFDT
jgi:apolipoprotein N-acyltransferase